MFISRIEIIEQFKSKKKVIKKADENFPKKNLSDPAFELRVRTVNALICADILTVEDLLSKNADDLSRIRNIGKSAIDELSSFLSEYGLTLKK